VEQVEAEMGETMHEVPDQGTLAGRAKAARVRSQENKTLELDVYPGVLAVRYRILPWEQVAAIRDRNRRIKSEGLRELYIACDQLIHACETAIEVLPDGQRDLELRYGPELATAVGIDNPPNSCTARQALLMIFDGDSRVMGHWGEYVEWTQEMAPEVNDDVMRDFRRKG